MKPTRVATVLASMVLTLLLPVAPAYGDPVDPGGPEPSDIDAVVDRVVPRQLADGRIPGAVVTVVAGGRTVFSQGYGLADVASDTPMDAEKTGLYTASEAKLFTATAALQLVRQGKLDLHTDVNRYLDDFTIPDTYPGRPVTLHHLLTYTSGFDNDVYGWSQWPAGALPTLADFAERVRPERIRPPGELVAYNNYDFVLIGRLIENASGRPFADYVTEHVLEPAGMSATKIHPTAAEVDSGVAGSYRPDGDEQARTAGLISPATPAGADVVTTGADMGRFMIAQLRQDAVLGHGVAKRMQQQQFASDPRIPGMGYAFEQRPRNGRQVIFKDGDLPGVHHSLALLPESGIGIHVAYNGDGVNGAAFWGGKELIDRIIAATVPAPGTKKPATRDGPVDSYAGNYADTRTSRTNFTAVTGLTTPITVRAVGPGRLTTTGLSEDPAVTEQRWHQIESGLFRSEDGTATIAFAADGRLVSSQTPAAAYEKLPWYRAPALHLGVLGAAALVLLAAFCVLPVRAMFARRAGRPACSAGARVALLLGWLVSACVVLFGGAFALISSDPNRLAQIPLTGDLTLSIALNTVSVMGVLTIGVVVLAVTGWVRRWGTVRGRVAYGLLTLAAIAFLCVALTYRLAGVPLTLTV